MTYRECSIYHFLFLIYTCTEADNFVTKNAEIQTTYVKFTCSHISVVGNVTKMT